MRVLLFCVCALVLAMFAGGWNSCRGDAHTPSGRTRAVAKQAPSTPEETHRGLSCKATNNRNHNWWELGYERVAPSCDKFVSQLERLSTLNEHDLWEAVDRQSRDLNDCYISELPSDHRRWFSSTFLRASVDAQYNGYPSLSLKLKRLAVVYLIAEGVMGVEIMHLTGRNAQLETAMTSMTRQLRWILSRGIDPEAYMRSKGLYASLIAGNLHCSE